MNCATVTIFGRRLPEQHLPIAELIAGWDFNAYSSDDGVIRELKRYLLLRKVLDRPITMESVLLDQAWHLFILDTVNYRTFCGAVFGAYLDHRSAHFPPDAELPKIYETFFGEQLPPVWHVRPNSSVNCA
ncbi:MAG: hypothetical protein U0136_00750 [Bdellovibrionota bacterium]